MRHWPNLGRGWRIWSRDVHKLAWTGLIRCFCFMRDCRRRLVDIWMPKMEAGS